MQPVDPLIGRVLDGYRIEALLGHGGMGRVYRALDVSLNRYAALKVLDPITESADKYRTRFNQEAQAIAKLKHPNIVAIYRFNEINDMYYMAMEYIDGADLRWVLKNYATDGQLIDYRNMLMILTQIAEALDYAHRNGVIHRDVKPSNIMVARDGDAILTDFGLALDVARGTQGTIFGSPHYIAPEQAIHSGDAVPQTDIYSFGVILYEMLTGDLPFSEGSVVQVAMAHISTPPPNPQNLNPDLHGAFIPVLEKVLAKDPQDRYQTASKLVQAVREAVREAEKRGHNTGRSTIGQPADRIREHFDQLASPPAEHTKEPTRMAGDPPKQSKKTDNGSSRMLLIMLLLVVIGGGAAAVAWRASAGLMNTSSATNDAQAANVLVEGIVTAIQTQETTLLIYDLPVTIDRNHPLWDVAETGDTIRIEGYAVATGTGYRFARIDRVVHNDDELDLEDDT